ncbi:M15 family metallopeptidase [bacterium]|nr:MAG: M15 family metallopeptidase [bacterium]
MYKYLSKILIFLGFITVAINPTLVFAQPASPAALSQSPAQEPTDLPVYNAGADQSIRDYVCAPSEDSDGQDLVRCINRLYKFGISAGALLLVFFVVYSGYLYILGGQNGKEKAKGVLPNALTGMAVLLGSYLLLYFINPNIVAFKPIQPPIFDAKNLANCEELGFGKDCIIVEEGIQPSGSGTVSSAGPCDLSMRTPAAAGAKMVNITIDVWKLSGSSKVASKSSLDVQGCVAEKFKAAFAQVYKDPEKFPIKSVGGYSFRNAVGSRNLSAHAAGLATDINYVENYYIKGNTTVGDFWRPCPGSNCSPYSIPANGSVYKAFKAQGFGWGGEWKSLKDYMHFSCLSNEQGKCF